MLRRPAAHRVVEFRPAIGAQGDDFTVQDCAFRLDSLGHRRTQVRERLKRVLFSRDQADRPGFQVRERAEPVILQLKKPIGVIKRLR